MPARRRPRGNTAVIGALREALAQAQAGRLVAFYGVVEYRGGESECLAAGVVDADAAAGRLADVAEWMAPSG